MHSANKSHTLVKLCTMTLCEYHSTNQSTFCYTGRHLASK